MIQNVPSVPQQRRGPRDEAPLSEDRRTVRKLLDIVGHNCQTVGPGSKGGFTVDSQQIRDGFARFATVDMDSR